MLSLSKDEGVAWESVLQSWGARGATWRSDRLDTGLG
jgi:hypothetical protein